MSICAVCVEVMRNRLDNKLPEIWCREHGTKPERRPLLASVPMTYTGKLRLHFNRHGAAPLVWCVATDDWEIAVAGIACTAPLRAVYRPKATADDDDGKPSAWFETEGVVTIIKSIAHITRTT